MKLELENLWQHSAKNRRALAGGGTHARTNTAVAVTAHLYGGPLRRKTLQADSSVPLRQLHPCLERFFQTLLLLVVV